jgi:carbon monoxide dehydrogenase subunit G
VKFSRQVASGRNKLNRNSVSRKVLLVELEHSFTVPAGIDTAWNTLLDVERIAMCMPGATLISVEGDTFKGEVKIKLGPVTMVFGGTASFVDKDVANHRLVINASGSETKGTSTAQATVTTQLVAESPTLTRVDVNTDLAITGKPAQFGRGVMSDVAGRIIGQFAGNLEGVVAAGSGTGNTTSSDSSASSAAMPAPAADAIDMMEVAGGAVAKKLIPVALVVVAVVVAWILLK